MHPVSISTALHSLKLDSLNTPLVIDDLVPGEGPWEVELGFGKGKYLLRRAGDEPHTRFLGLEVAGKYFRHVERRLRKRELNNLLLVRGEALYVLSAVLPRSFAAAVHLYFPDPWPKGRHHGRRLIDPETVDLVLQLLRPGGRLYFATDHQEYGRLIESILGTHPGIRVTPLSEEWPDGARTHYETKYSHEGRGILRLEVERTASSDERLLHPAGVHGILTASCDWREFES